MTIYSLIVDLLGTPPNDIVMYLYYVVGAFIIIYLLRLILSLFFKFVLGIKH